MRGKSNWGNARQIRRTTAMPLNGLPDACQQQSCPHTIRICTQQEDSPNPLLADGNANLACEYTLTQRKISKFPRKCHSKKTSPRSTLAAPAKSAPGVSDSGRHTTGIVALSQPERRLSARENALRNGSFR